jgi:hypothetical protein
MLSIEGPLTDFYQLIFIVNVIIKEKTLLLFDPPMALFLEDIIHLVGYHQTLIRIIKTHVCLPLKIFPMSRHAFLKIVILLFNQENSTNNMYNSPSNGPCFGGGHDISICSGCNTLNSNYTNFGHTYDSTSVAPYGNVLTKSFLAGSYNFMVSEIEIFVPIK